MDNKIYEELGYLGVNVDDNVTPQYTYTELIRHAEEGDDMALFKLINVARHYEGEDKELIRSMAYNAATRIEKERKGLPVEESEDEE